MRPVPGIGKEGLKPAPEDPVSVIAAGDRDYGNLEQILKKPAEGLSHFIADILG